MSTILSSILFFFRKNLELFFWLGSLVFLGLTASPDSHFSLCIFKLCGIGWCPGCGIGHAIGYALQGSFSESWESHWLGIPALFVILQRVWGLLIIFFTAKAQRREGPRRSYSYF